MTRHEVRRDGLRDETPEREALIGAKGGRRPGRGGEMVPPAEFRSYYGRSVLKPPVWSARDIAGYLFLGGVAGGAALLAAGGDLTGRGSMRRAGRLISAGATGLGLAALIHDLGRPARFAHMLRVLKPTSPMSVGTWLLGGFGPLVGAAAAAELVGAATAAGVSGALPPSAGAAVRALGRSSGLAASLVAPALTTYTGVLIANTAVPLWHDAHRELPYLFGASALAGAGGLVAASTAVDEAGPARAAGIAGVLMEQALDRRIHKRLGMVAEPLDQGYPGRLMRASRLAGRAGAVLLAGSALRRSKALDVAGGLALAASSLLARFGYFHAGNASATDPRYTVVPQRERADRAGSVGAQHPADLGGGRGVRGEGQEPA
ncbi:NrfD/PsrC family molybdoenzyme membrane anchor subunit [Rhizomonospora bruguierae]|uniref:NrfD/PsrC family molybdoenzyme membrane anchor subunit n=1 Tax=Rhizomonospora bruguierae TaxID=1581705 RepID=UPI0020BF20D8|nr:NrfD/PsrC family molybdoenzyme membrane anchor subunit [Micromonospora sp. NBRC 107566]